jgi:hypothetical protein
MFVTLKGKGRTDYHYNINAIQLCYTFSSAMEIRYLKICIPGRVETFQEDQYDIDDFIAQITRKEN